MQLFRELTLANSTLLNNLGNSSSTDRTAAFTDSKAHPFFHSNRSDQFSCNLNVIAWHNHLNSCWKFNCSCYVCCTEVELRTISGEERLMTSTFFFCQNVNRSFELRMRCACAWSSKNHSAFDIVFLKPRSRIPTFSPARASSKNFIEHFKTGRNGFTCFAKTNELKLIVDLDNTALDTTCRNSTTTGDREHVFNRHQEWLINFTCWCWDLFIDSFHQFYDCFNILRIAFKSFQSGTADDWTSL